MIGILAKWLLTLLVAVALLPTALKLLAGASPALIALALVFGVALFGPIRRGFFDIAKGVASALFALFGGLAAIITAPFAWLFRSGGHARFMGAWERYWLLGGGNDGVLVDGRAARLPEKETYQSLLVQGGMGRGKSSTFVMPNLLQLPSSQPSMVMLDTSGEIFDKTSGYLRRQGYQIRALNLMEPSRSERWNPMALATTPQAIAELAKIIISSSQGGGFAGAKDPFWDQAAIKLLRLLAQCLQNQPDAHFRNLANLRRLITSFDAHTAPNGQLGKVDHFVLNATANDPSTFAGYQAFVQGNLKVIQSVLMTADVALDPIGTPELAALTASSSFDLADLRRHKTALYVIVNQTQMGSYRFLLNLLFSQLFRVLLTNARNPGRPVWLWLDEFGHLQIPEFEVFATTARKYKVMFAIFLQSLAQLESRYGRHNAKTIRDGLGTEILLPGLPLEEAREVEARLGRVAGRKGAPAAPLMSAAEIIRMNEDQALMLHSNRLPVLLSTRRYFQRADLRRRANRKPAPLPQNATQQPPLIQL